MANSYCGKCCGECALAEQLNCPGCKAEQYSPMAAQCAIAACCRSRGHDNCETCNFRENCPNWNKRDANPQQIVQKQAELQRRAQAEAEVRAQAQAQLREVAAILGKWVWVLFWLAVGPLALSLLNGVDALSNVIAVIGILISVICGWIYLKKLSEVDDGFRLASLGHFITALSSLLGLFITEGGALDTVLSLVFLLPSLVGMYYEFTTYSDILQGVDNELSEKWRKLWKIFIICTGIIFGSLVLVLLLPGLAALSALGGVIGMLVSSVLEWVYLYKTAKVFRDIN